MARITARIEKFSPDASEALAKANVSPLIREIDAGKLNLSSLLQRLAGKGSTAFILEQVLAGKAARFSYLFYEPFQTLTIRDGALAVATGGEVERLAGNPLEALKNHLQQFEHPEMKGLPPFACGAVGYLGYDCIRYLEKIALPDARSSEDEACFVVFRNVVVLDRERKKAILVANRFSEGDGEETRRAESAISAMTVAVAEEAVAPEPGPAPVEPSSLDTSLNVEEKPFADSVSAIKRHIRAGDIFQCVISERKHISLGAHPLSVFQTLATLNPSPYLYYFNSGAQTLLGSSPELLVRVQDGVAETCPIAGTRPRGKSPAEDKRLERQLLASPKERAEHLMLVDLSRNDLGRVSEPGTVRVRDFMTIQRLSHVMHIVSTVEGRLASNRTAIEALFACFPAGTLTGAPKIRAMEIISQLEKERRGAYGGAVVLYDFNGQLDSCITIRSLVVKNGIATVQAGAGIVADSTPRRELLEIQAKAQAVCKAVQSAEIAQETEGGQV